MRRQRVCFWLIPLSEFSSLKSKSEDFFAALQEESRVAAAAVWGVCCGGCV